MTVAELIERLCRLPSYTANMLVTICDAHGVDHDLLNDDRRPGVPALNFEFTNHADEAEWLADHPEKVADHLGEAYREMFDIARDRKGDAMRVDTMQIEEWSLGSTTPFICDVPVYRPDDGGAA